MKKSIFILTLLLIVPVSVSAQFDEKFYRPDKEWVGLEGKYEEIVFNSGADTVHSVLFMPEGRPVATVLYFHGNGSNISKWAGHVKPLVDAGMQVCMMDYRGYGKSTGTPTHDNIAGDARTLYSILIKRRDVRRMPVIVYGASIGSQAASLIAMENDGRVAALVLDGAMTSFTDVAVAASPPEHAEMIRRYVVSPYSAKDNVPGLRDTKLLVIHSEEDFIPVEGAKEMYESAVCEKYFWLYEGSHVAAPLLFPGEFAKRVSALIE